MHRLNAIERIIPSAPAGTQNQSCVIIQSIIKEGIIAAISYVSGFISIIFLALISALFLFLSLKIFKVERRTLGFSFLLTLAYGIFSGLSNLFLTGKINGTIQFCLGIVVSWAIVALVINFKYKTGLPKASLIWLVWAVFNFILSLIFALIASAFAAFVSGFTGG